MHETSIRSKHDAVCSSRLLSPMVEHLDCCCRRWFSSILTTCTFYNDQVLDVALVTVGHHVVMLASKQSHGKQDKIIASNYRFKPSRVHRIQ